MRRLAYGPAAWLLDGVDDPAALGRAIVAASLDGVDDVVPAESTVLVRCAAATAPQVGSRLDSIVPLPVDAADRDPLIIDVVYDGVDLADLARSVGSRGRRGHRTAPGGCLHRGLLRLQPGFGYLRGLDPVLHIDRRATPRTVGTRWLRRHRCGLQRGVSVGVSGRMAPTRHDHDGCVGRSGRPSALMQPGRLVRFRRVDP